MLTFPSTVRVYLAPGATDMRKSFDTLAAVAREVLEKDPLSGHLFAFCGRRRNLVKILVWDSCGVPGYVTKRSGLEPRRSFEECLPG